MAFNGITRVFSFLSINSETPPHTESIGGHWTLERQRTNRVDLPAVNRAPVLNALSVACLILLFIDARGCIVEHDRGKEGIGSKGRLIQTEEEDEEGGVKG